MKTIKTDSVSIEIVISDTEEGNKHILVKYGFCQCAEFELPASIVKSKFTDAALIRHITNFLIKD